MVRRLKDNVFSVSEVNNLVKRTLEKERSFGNLQVRGEISNFKTYSSGHSYFTLKDENSVLKCVMFKSAGYKLKFKPQNGDVVIVLGRLTVYERDGVYQLYTDLMIADGYGNLMERYERLKEQLKSEGLFDEAKKKSLPINPKTVGIITSPSGAAIHDLIKVSTRRNNGIKIILYPVRVQGDEAPKEIARAIRFMNKHHLADVLIVGRGGGSIEELWAFNEEVTVRAVAASQIPIVSAVGHATDFTLTDFAADKRAATPSEAAELVVLDANAYRNYIENLCERAESALISKLVRMETRLDKVLSSWVFTNPERMLADKIQAVDSLSADLVRNMDTLLERKENEFSLNIAKLNALSPLGVMARGYSLTQSDGKILRSIDDVFCGTEIITQLSDGKLLSVVTDKKGN